MCITYVYTHALVAMPSFLAAHPRRASAARARWSNLSMVPHVRMAETDDTPLSIFGAWVHACMYITLCMYLLVCVYIYIHIHTHMQTCMHACMHTYTDIPNTETFLNMSLHSDAAMSFIDRGASMEGNALQTVLLPCWLPMLRRLRSVNHPTCTKGRQAYSKDIVRIP